MGIRKPNCQCRHVARSSSARRECVDAEAVEGVLTGRIVSRVAVPGPIRIFPLRIVLQRLPSCDKPVLRTGCDVFPFLDRVRRNRAPEGAPNHGAVRGKESRDELGLGPVVTRLPTTCFRAPARSRHACVTCCSCPGSTRWSKTWTHLPSGSCRRREVLKSVSSMPCASAGGEGVIGRFAHSQLQRLPSSVYWNGLRSWGIRRFAGSQEAYFASMADLRRYRLRKRSASDSPDDESRSHAAWCADLPCRPDGLLERADFKLTGDEASFLSIGW